MLRSENSLLQDELRRAQEVAEKAPSNVMTSLIEKLRNDLTDKDKKIRALGRVVADLKTELVNNAVAKENSRYDCQINLLMYTGTPHSGSKS